MRRVQMHDGAGLGALLIHDTVQEALLGRRIARHEPAVVAELRQPRRVEPAERGVGRRHQPAIRHPQADIAGRPGRQAAVEDRRADPADRLASLGFVHEAAPLNTSKARRKKSSAPKLPDLSASASFGSPRLTVHGTPGSIWRPMRNPVTPSACTTAPDVSPPATTSRRTPRSTRPDATR